VAVDRVPGGISVRVTGEMDIATAPQLVAIMGSLSRRGMHHVWLDLTGLTFIDATGLAALVQARRMTDR
jgi:anti-sigma B factor antagonist